jgi:hypothetical protein
VQEREGRDDVCKRKRGGRISESESGGGNMRECARGSMGEKVRDRGGRTRERGEDKRERGGG